MVNTRFSLFRWGIDKQSFDSLSDSEKRKFSNNKQSKIDVFFKNPPQPSTKDAVMMMTMIIMIVTMIVNDNDDNDRSE